MNFDEIVVKEIPGLCRCCLSEGCYKDLGTEYTWMNDTEVYADMLLDCFDIGITQHNDGPNGPKRLICEVCITRLRDACNFKKQVLDSEKRFIDMLGRGEFRPKCKMLLLFQPQGQELKSEALEEAVSMDLNEAEYLDDMDYGGDEEVIKTEELQPTSLPTTSEEPKPKRGRPRKEEHNSGSLAKVVKKPKVAKGVTKRQIQKSYSCLDRLNIVRRNITTVLRYSHVIPFNWNTKGFRCFFCAKSMKNCDFLKEHTLKHNSIDIHRFINKHIITKNIPIKIDITHLACKVCAVPFSNLEDLIAHIVDKHDGEYDSSAGVCFFPFILNTDMMNCVLCENNYDNFRSMIGHMYKQHISHSYMCQMCGLSFKDQIRLKRHITTSHLGFKCTLCSKTFDASHKLQKHKQRFHGQVKLYECSLCSEKFLNRYRLKVHLGKVHSVEKYTVKCEHCPKVCTTKGAMLIHVQCLHSDIKCRCDLCDYTAGIKWMIKLHKRKHSGLKEYSCSICGRHFGRSSNLRAHMKVHTGNSGRVCRFCRKGFADAEFLEKHELEVH